jgi:hypothetical protein
MVPYPPPQDNIRPIEVKYLIDPTTKNFNPLLTESQCPYLLHAHNFDSRNPIDHMNPLYQWTIMSNVDGTSGSRGTHNPMSDVFLGGFDPPISGIPMVIAVPYSYCVSSGGIISPIITPNSGIKMCPSTSYGGGTFSSGMPSTEAQISAYYSSYFSFRTPSIGIHHVVASTPSILPNFNVLVGISSTHFPSFIFGVGHIHALIPSMGSGDNPISGIPIGSISFP